MRALSDLMDLVIINVLTLLCFLPVVTAGAALSSMHYCLMKVLEGEDAGLAKMFFTQFKGNFKSSTPVWLVVLAVGVFAGFDLTVFRRQGEGELRPLLIVVFLVAILMLALFVWLFPLLARFDNRFVLTWRNAMLLAVGQFPRTILMMAITAVIPFVLTQDMRLLPLAFVFGLSLPGYLCALLYRPVIKKMIASAEEKEKAKEEAQKEETL